MKPIEVGCMVVIIGGLEENLGRICIAVEQGMDFGRPAWNVQGENLVGTDIFGQKTSGNNLICYPDQLRRIDGEEFDTSEVTEEKQREVS